MEIPILQDIVVILGLSIVIILAFQKIKVPSILGFLLAGIIAGPHAFNLINSRHEVELLSEIGIIFLLFVIGIELSLKGLAAIKKTIFIGGGLQVGGTILFTAVISQLLGLPFNTAVFLGFLFSLSSTAIVLKLFQQSGEITSPHGRISIGVLIFQDIIVVPMMLVTPILAGNSDNVLKTIAILVAKMAIVLLVIFLLAKYVVPTVFGWVVKTKNQELFILTVVVFCFSVAWLTSSVGLSLALGAFFAGLIISESDYSHQATANVLPFREIFISFFFISVGTLLDLKFFFNHIGYIILLTIGVMLLKMLVLGITVFALKHKPRTVFLTVFSLFQVGEFSLLLSGVGLDNGLLPDHIYQYFLAICIVSMALTPFLIMNASKITYFILQAPIPASVRHRLANIKKNTKSEEQFSEEHLRDHIVIIGYGTNGENIAKAARSAEIPYVIVDLDPESFNKAKERNEPVVFGDATNSLILKHIHIQEARVVVIAVSDTRASKKMISSVRLFTKTAFIIVRTRQVKEIEEHLKIGADEVIPADFETSIEIFTRVLRKYLVPQDEIMAFTNTIRSADYELLTRLKTNPHKPGFHNLHIPHKEIATLSVQQNNKAIVGKSLEQSGIGKNFGINVLAIQRNNKFLTEIAPSTKIKHDDLIYVFGNPANINHLNSLLAL